MGEETDVLYPRPRDREACSEEESSFLQRRSLPAAISMCMAAPQNWAARIRGALCDLSVRGHCIAQQAARACALSLYTVTTRSFTHIGALQASKLQYACMQSARRVFANQANECLKLYVAVKVAKFPMDLGKRPSYSPFYLAFSAPMRNDLCSVLQHAQGDCGPDQNACLQVLRHSGLATGRPPIPIH